MKNSCIISQYKLLDYKVDKRSGKTSLPIIKHRGQRLWYVHYHSCYGNSN